MPEDNAPMASDKIDEMARLESGYWWFRCLHDQTIDALSRHVSLTGKILDAGCGTGGLMRHLLSLGYRAVAGFDISPHAVEHCRTDGLSARVARLQDIRLLSDAGSISAIVSNDTLCYLSPSERSSFFSACADLLQPGGVLILNVPAGTLMRGRHDTAVGILHRFSLTEMNRLETPSLYLQHHRFWPSFLAPLIALHRLAQRSERRAHLPQSDLQPLHPMLNRFFYWVTELELRLMRRGWYASSLFTLYRKRAREGRSF